MTEHPDTIRARRKIRVHVICILIGAVITVVLTYIPLTASITSHVAFGIPAVPSVAQEVFDRLMGI